MICNGIHFQPGKVSLELLLYYIIYIICICIHIYIVTMHSPFPRNWEPWKVCFPYHASPTQRYPGRGQQLQSLSAPLSLSCQFLILLSLLPRRRCLVRLVTRRFRGPRSGHTLELLIPEQIWGKVFFFSISRCTEYYSVVKLFACTRGRVPRVV